MTQWDPIQSLIENCRISQHNEAVVAEFVLRYYREMNDVERLFLLRDTLSEEEHTSILKLGIAAKLQVHNRYWEETDDEYWKPCSLSSSEESAFQTLNQSK